MPRRRSIRLAAALGALVAGCMALAAAAQTPTPSLPSLLRPEVDGDRKNPPRFRRPAPAPRTVPGLLPATPTAPTTTTTTTPSALPKSTPRDQTRPGELPKFEVPKFGNPPASGTGTSGFVSTNIAKAKREAKARALARTPAGHAHALRFRPLPSIITLDTSRTPPALRIRNDPRTDADRMAAALALRRPPNAPDILLALRRVEQDPFEPLGIRAGAFILKPAIELTGAYDNNAPRTTPSVGSWLFMVAPELLVRSNWSRHEVRADLRGTYTTYPGYDGVPSLNRPFADAKVFGRLDVTRETRIDGEGRFLLSTDNPGSPNLQAGLAKFPIYTTLGSTLGVTQRFNRFEFTAKGSVDRTVYQSSYLADGTTATNDDRDFNQYGGLLRASYELLPFMKPFVEVGADRRLHDLTFDRSGLMRDSKGVVAKAGTTFELSRILVGEVSLGYLNRTYKDPTLPDLAGLTIDGSLTWFASPLTTAKLTGTTRAEESIVAGVSGTFRRDIGLQVDHAFRRWLIGTVKLGYGIDDYIGSPREDHRYSASVALLYKLTREMQLKSEFRQEWLHSNTPGNDYTASVVLLGLRLQR